MKQKQKKLRSSFLNAKQNAGLRKEEGISASKPPNHICMEKEELIAIVNPLDALYAAKAWRVRLITERWQLKKRNPQMVKLNNLGKLLSFVLLRNTTVGGYLVRASFIFILLLM